MANQFLSYIYGIDAPGGKTEISAPGGEPNTFPSASGVRIYPTTQTRGVAQVACQSVIELLPTGLNQKPTKFYSAETVAALQTKANT